VSSELISQININNYNAVIKQLALLTAWWSLGQVSNHIRHCRHQLAGFGGAVRFDPDSEIFLSNPVGCSVAGEEW